MRFNDDEPIVAIQDVSGEEPEAFEVGKTKITIISNHEAPLEETEFKVALELTGVESDNERPGVDLVTVLDVSGSMEGEKLAKLKTALQFVIHKLSPIDRLSVVTFSADCRRLCPLRQISENSQVEIENLISNLVAGGEKNITAGLQTGLKVLDDRSFTDGRVAAIMLISDGEQNNYGDAAQVPVGNMPVYTFGFGADHDPKVLMEIAENSKGGTFTDVRNEENLSIALSQCLAGLLTVVVQDLKLTVTQAESTIEKIKSGNFSQARDGGSVTVSFGDLCNKEVRKVVVDLLLPAVSSGASVNVLDINYTYRSIGGKLFDAVPPLTVTVTRTGTLANRETEEVVKIEAPSNYL